MRLPLLARRSSWMLALILADCDDSPRLAAVEPGERLSGGSATVPRSDRNAYSLPAANLSAERRVDFSAGNSFFRNPWVIAPSTTTARDGLGPLFNTNACQNCHVRGGRGHPPEAQALSAVSMVVRLSLPAGTADEALVERRGVVPEPTYGLQLQDMAIPGVAPEGKVRVDYQPVTLVFSDGTRVQLRRPELRVSRLGYGPLHAQAQLSARVAPPMIGLGLLEAIPEAAITANEAAQAARDNGVRGRVNQVWDSVQGRTVAGRFGWKAGQPTLDQQNAHALANDMGLTSSLHPADDCSAMQLDCLAAPNGNGTADAFEVSDNIRRLLLFYTRNVAVPARRGFDDPQVLQGKMLFRQSGCQSCHVPSYVTANDAVQPELRNLRIWPYTDLLLHDMGPGLADDHSEFKARGQDWRTPPLWGIGLSERVTGHSQFLHDGRARNLLEAVLWHDGEARAARDRVLTFDAGQRAALLAFLDSL